MKMVITIQQCTSTKFQSYCRTSDYGTKFAQKILNDKNFEKTNIKTVICI